jgi:PAS domain S-box-containing protein
MDIQTNNSTSSTWLRRKRQLMTQPFVHAVSSSPVPIILTDPHEHDHPIVFANDSFVRLTGYKELELLGQNCRFLQGPSTDKSVITAMKEAISGNRDIAVEILNYRKNGSMFWNELHIAPIFDENGETLFFIGSLVDVTTRIAARNELADLNQSLERRIAERTDDLKQAAEHSALLAREVTHRVRNSLALLTSLIELQQRSALDNRDRDLLREVGSRIRAVGRIQTMLDDVAVGASRIDVMRLLATLCEDLDMISTAQVRLEMKTSFQIPPEQALPVALIVTELVLNAQKHAFPSGLRNDVGTVEIRAGVDLGEAAIEVEDDGQGLPEDFDIEAVNGTGMLVIKSQISGIGGRVVHQAGKFGGALFQVFFPVAVS